MDQPTVDQPVYDVQVLLPVHNEAESIEATIREMYAEFSKTARVQFIICEDGSRDNTQEVLRRVAETVPAILLLSKERKGYSRAVRDGMMAMSAPYLLCADADGQCEPKEFARFWAIRQNADVVTAWRVHRADNWMRKAMSRTFFRIWKLFYNCPVHDPSFAFVLARRDVVQRIAPQMGRMQQGFFWEFAARGHRLGYRFKELPVHHRFRAAGATQVYHLSKLPGIGWRHFVALFQILRETRPGAV